MRSDSIVYFAKCTYAVPMPGLAAPIPRVFDVGDVDVRYSRSVSLPIFGTAVAGSAGLPAVTIALIENKK